MFTEEHDKFLLEAYFRTGMQNGDEWEYSLGQCREQFLQKYVNFEDIDYCVFTRHIRRVVDRFRNSGSVCKGKSTGRHTILTEMTLDDVRDRLETSPNKSLRSLSQQTGLSYGTCQRATRKLHMHPYKVSVVQELLPLDNGKRLDYCQWFNENLVDDNVLNLTFFTDEAWFHLSGFVNSQNYRTWSTENPHTFIETSLHPQKVGVWVAMSRRRIIGPIFFNETINAERYRGIILDPFINELHDDELTNGYFQQDGATAHTANVTLNYLREFFDNRIISRNRWPPRSPDLTPLDFYLFGHLKNKIYSNRLHTLLELQETIRNAIEEITPDQLINVFEGVKRRVNKCIESGGGHFEHLLS